MKTLRCTKTNQSIDLTTSIATSGEGEVWQTNRPGTLAKIYHDPTADRIAKLRVMIAHPPSDPNQHQHHISYAWPQSLLEEQGRPVGFLMPEIKDGRELLNIYTPKLRKRNHLEIDWRFLHVTAMNVAALIARLHAEGYVLGDIKPQNILVNSRALPSIIDTDSFQVRDPETGVLHHCPVGSPEFTPPELMGKDLATTEQTVAHDAFRLGVLIYLLLFGSPPFQGDWVGPGDRPEPNEWIRQGLWPHGESGLVQVSRNTIPLDIVHSSLKALFLQCLNEGNVIPERRPKADIWKNTLELGINNLVQCGHTDRHIYNQNHDHCYWCQRKEILGVDIFNYLASAAYLGQTDFSSSPVQSQHQPKYNNYYGSLKPSKYTLNNYRSQIHSIRVQITTRTKDISKAFKNYARELNIKILELKKHFEINPKLAMFLAHTYGNLVLNASSFLKNTRKSLFLDYKAVIAILMASSVMAIALLYVLFSLLTYSDFQDYYESGAARYNLRQYEAAIADLDKAIRLNPDFGIGYKLRGDARYELGQHEAAITDFNEAIRIHSGYVAAYSNRGLTKCQLNQYEAAIADLNKTIDINPNYGRAYRNRGIVKYELGQYEAAIADFDKAISINLIDAEAYRNRGFTREMLGQTEAADKDFQEAETKKRFQRI